MISKNSNWFTEAKFGMFIHWGLYSVPAGEYKGTKVKGNAEWIQLRMNIPHDEYSSYTKDFNPVKFDAAEWVDIAKSAGMKYIVITAKHHDGFAMFKSSDSYNIYDMTPFKRDPIAELAKECEKAGVKLCFYYSHVLDWAEQNAFRDEFPEDMQEEIKAQNIKFNNYLQNKVKPQLTELLTNYGEIGVIWFDMPGCVDKKYCEEIYSHVKSLQPDCLVSGRIGYGIGDFATVGDNKIPALPSDKLWEMPGTLNDTWGFKSGDRRWKPMEELKKILIKVLSRGGNYLLNVGPDKEGVIPEESVKILKSLGEYVTANADGIYGTSPMPLYPYDISEEGFFTFKTGNIFYHSFKSLEKLTLPCIKSGIKSVTLLQTGEELPFVNTYSDATESHELVIDFPSDMDDAKGIVIKIAITDAVPQFEQVL